MNNYFNTLSILEYLNANVLFSSPVSAPPSLYTWNSLVLALGVRFKSTAETVSIDS